MRKLRHAVYGSMLHTSVNDLEISPGSAREILEKNADSAVQNLLFYLRFTYVTRQYIVFTICDVYF